MRGTRPIFFIPLYLRLDALHVHDPAFLSADILLDCVPFVSWLLTSGSTTPVLEWLLDFALHIRVDTMDMPEVHDININGQITVIFNVTSCHIPDVDDTLERGLGRVCKFRFIRKN